MSAIQFNQFFPQEIAASILAYAVSGERSLNCRQVCKYWKKLVDTDVFKLFVMELKKNIERVPNAMNLKSIVTAFILEANPSGSDPFQFDSTRLFKFTELLNTTLGNKARLIASSQQIQESAEQNTNLHVLWNAIKGIYPKSSPPLKTAEEISSWMRKNPKSLEFITKLHMHDKGLTSIPSEIGLLTKLQNLNVSCNQILSLPHELKLLTHLRVLAIDYNNFKEPPDIEGLQLTMFTSEGNPYNS